MRREYRQRPGDVIARRIDTAARGAGKPVDGTGSRALALLAVHGDDDGERLHGRRAVARHVMRSHGCKGGKCGYGAHAEHLAVRDELLAVLGLGGEQR